MLTPKRIPRVGTIVRHTIFGLGQVKKRTAGTLLIRFRAHGYKELITGLAMMRMTIVPTKRKD